MGALMRQFNSSLQTPGQPTGAGNAPVQAGDSKPQTDNSGLRTEPTVWVRDPDGNNEPFPRPDVDYDFCLEVVNTGKLPSGPFMVVFKLEGDMNWDDKFEQTAGL